MTNEKPNECKSKVCKNPVLKGKYCEYCKQVRKEKRGDLLKVAGSAVALIGPIVLAVIFKKDPNEPED